MVVIGLTGSIGMGKSSAGDTFRSMGIAVFDADAEVHRLYSGPAAPLIEARFPGTTSNGVVDRGRLSLVLMDDPAGFSALETLVHPLVRAAEFAFIQFEHGRGAEMAVLDIPLLLETGTQKLVDVVVVVSATAALQEERVLARPGMTRAKLASIIARQMPDSVKRQHADFVVDTSGSIENSIAAIKQIVLELKSHPGGVYDAYWRETA